MKHKVVAPSVGESITEVSILKWAKQHGQAVKSGDMLLEIESDKATVEVVAENAGVLEISKQAGERIPVGEIIGYIDDAGTASVAASAAPSASPQSPPPMNKPAPASLPPTSVPPSASASAAPASSGPGAWATMGPGAKKTADERGVDPNQINGSGKDGRVTKGDVLGFKPSAVSNASAASTSIASAPAPAAPKYQLQPGDRRVPMSMLRAKIAEKLVQAQHNAAILTTFNECDMSAVMKERNQIKDAFKAKHGVPLSFMSYFAFACIEALKAVPEVNGKIDGRDMIYSDYYDLGIAVGTERGLVVPVIRGVDKLTVVDLEKKLAELALKARNNKLSIAEMTGGTFTISNGGTYGSLMSTPILNAPQSGILGMHKIMDRPMAVDGKIEIRPMMYLALSYDHRIIDGKGAVTFLVKVKEFIENPSLMKMSLGL